MFDSLAMTISSYRTEKTTIFTAADSIWAVAPVSSGPVGLAGVSLSSDIWQYVDCEFRVDLILEHVLDLGGPYLLRPQIIPD
jgi:hypothetical protein